MIDPIPVARVLVKSVLTAKAPHCVYVFREKESPIMEFYNDDPEARARYELLVSPDIFEEVGIEAVLLFVNKYLVEDKIRNTVMIHFDHEN